MSGARAPRQPFVATEEQRALVAEALTAFANDVSYAVSIANAAIWLQKFRALSRERAAKKAAERAAAKARADALKAGRKAAEAAIAALPDADPQERKRARDRARYAALRAAGLAVQNVSPEARERKRVLNRECQRARRAAARRSAGAPVPGVECVAGHIAVTKLTPGR